MKNLVILSFLLLSMASHAQEKKIVFFGYRDPLYNGMTSMLQKIVDETGEKIKVVEMTGFRSLTNFVTSVRGMDVFSEDRLPNGQLTEAVQELLGLKPDITILVDNVTSLLNPYIRSISTEPAMLWLDSAIKAKGANTVLFQNFPWIMAPNGPIQFSKEYVKLQFFNWDRQKKFDSTNSAIWPFVADSFVKSNLMQNWTAEVLEAKLELDIMAKKMGAKVLPAGYVMELCRIKYPEIPLYGAGMLPTKQAAYLMACVTYKFLTGKSLVSIKYKPEITTDEAKTMRELVEKVTS